MKFLTLALFLGVATAEDIGDDVAHMLKISISKHGQHVIEREADDVPTRYHSGGDDVQAATGCGKVLGCQTDSSWKRLQLRDDRVVFQQSAAQVGMASGIAADSGPCRHLLWRPSALTGDSARSRHLL